MPLMEDRHRVLNEAGRILLEKFGGSFLNCVQKSEKSAQKLMHLVVENFPSYRDVTEFEVLAHLGALKYSDELLQKLHRGEMLSYGDKQEVEIRGCSLWCVELIRDCLLELIEKQSEKPHGEINSVLLDYYLWDYARDHRDDMKGIPFHRTRCIYY
ncbi:queuosine salvage protein isoform X2 [Fukomys damarensis]|uniref:queuosine salvage protein isoform X2 n=1 Tax=Fukomys damarensis TaxID=885580 RepID=UPI0008FEE7B8|nr:queuosine salvage protein isoform X2 [Fukomys damarensis]